ncbi:SGNH/GDSL hydrolase family protein [Zooshikella marina]|uniref:SGNH/GDSL hydrolase family protein n=1 Tax=Zooshikella ganghwensis TaxID=202772 RepID=UPI001BAED6CD|nr:SGNH/GDSL hydrolase family protein [Zooshikella ganghwensis]MBU2707299.1 SGNH/GDSL hydrolase family protein [Zooshikella ganghwensis]
MTQLIVWLKKTIVIVVINVVLVLIVLYGFEFFFSPYRSLPKNGFYEDGYYTWGNLVKVNKLGFREKNFTFSKQDNVFRVMVLGDSLTWGAGLSIKERYTEVAEKNANDSRENIKYEILNFGLPSASTVHERNILYKYHKIVNPDLIVVGFCLNDTQSKSQNFSHERYHLYKDWGYLVHSLANILNSFGLSYTGKVLKELFYTLAELFGIIPNWQDALDRTYNRSSQEWDLFEKALIDIKDISDSLDLPPPVFAILNQGTYTDKPTNYASPNSDLQLFLKWYHQAEEIAKNIGFTVYNHEKEIIDNLNNKNLAVNVLDGHPSSELNKVYGEKLAKIILNY